MAVTIRVEKHPLKDFQPSRYCEWCVTVDNDAPGGWDGPRQWAIDLPGDTDILDPEIARKIKGAPKYTVDPGEGQGTITRPHAKSFKICFVAACEERKGTVDLSLESRFDAPTGGGVLDPPPWERVPFEGGPNGLGKIVGPASVARAASPARDEIATLARFEASKLALLLGLAREQESPLAAEPIMLSRTLIGGSSEIV